MTPTRCKMMTAWVSDHGHLVAIPHPMGNVVRLELSAEEARYLGEALADYSSKWDSAQADAMGLMRMADDIEDERTP